MFFIHANFFDKDYKVQKFNFCNNESTFFQINVQSKFFEFLKYLTNMSLMFRRFTAVNQNIIQINYTNNINKISQNFIDINLKNR